MFVLNMDKYVLKWLRLYIGVLFIKIRFWLGLFLCISKLVVFFMFCVIFGSSVIVLSKLVLLFSWGSNWSVEIGKEILLSFGMLWLE